ncbi:MAG: AAA family ATPase [bacterium]|nr:AAA family ATPase [bacterium]
MSSDPSEPIGADPFGSTTAAEGYVVRPACERALDELLAAVRREAPCIALVGPNGIGKTQLMRVLAERLAEETELLLLPYAALEFPDLCHWALGLLGEDQGPFSDPGGALLEAAARRASAGRRLILALDDASGLPIETARELSALVRQAPGELQLLVIPVDDPRAGRVLAALGSDVALVRFNTPMSAEESAAYIRERLRASGVGPAIQDRFTEQVLAWLHRESGGLPRELHILAVQFLRDRPEADRDRFSRREQWLEIDSPEDEPETEPAAEAELLEAEDEEPPKPESPETQPPREPPRAAPHIPLPPPSDERGWLRSHLLLVSGLGLMALGIFFALRTDVPTETPAASIDVPVGQESVAEPAVEQVAEPVMEEEVQEPSAKQPSDLATEPQMEGTEELVDVLETAPEPAPEIETPDEPAPPAPSDDLTPPSSTAEAPAPAEAVEPSPPVAVEEATDTPPISPEPLPEATPEAEEIAAPEPEPPAPAPEEPPSEPATNTASEPSPTPSPPEPAARPPSAPRPLPVAATGPPVTIRVEANPPARVLVDGRDLGQTPVAEVTLASGRHRFEVIFPDGTILLREKLIDDRRPEIRFNKLPRP